MFIDTGTLTGIMIALGASAIVHFIAYRRITVLERQLWRTKRKLAVYE